MPYKKYFFLEPEPWQYPELENDSSKRRIKEELALYHQLMENDRIVEVDGGLTYYLVSKDWISKWRDFASNKGPHPGKVMNEPLALKIQAQRAHANGNRYQAHDNSVTVTDASDCFTLSRDFWMLFESRYHCDVVIQIRKYSDIGSLVKKTILTGETWSAI